MNSETDTPAPIRTLVIDDHPAIVKLVRIYAGRSGLGDFDVRGALCLDDMEAIFANDTFDLVLLDGYLSVDVNFRHALERLEDVFDGPVVMLSGMIPHGFGSDPKDARICATILKDELATPVFVNTLRDVLQATGSIRSVA